MDEWHFIAERKIREAIEDGSFDHLEGAGRPLPLAYAERLVRAVTKRL